MKASPDERMRVLDVLIDDLSEQEACRILGISTTQYRRDAYQIRMYHRVRAAIVEEEKRWQPQS
jgi:DNA-directed RNA polymerase specialized sigma24 family protein